jgi:hypothetical protein
LRSENAFFSNRSNSQLCYIRNDFDCLEFSKCVSHLNFLLHSCSSYCFKTYHHPNFINFLDCSRLHIGVLTSILTWFLFFGHKMYWKAYWLFPVLICQQILWCTKNAFGRSENGFFANLSNSHSMLHTNFFWLFRR